MPTATAIAAPNPGWPNRSGNNPPINAPTLATTPGVANSPATAAPTASPITGATGTSPSSETTNADTVAAAYCCTSALVPRSVISPATLIPAAVQTALSPNKVVSASVVKPSSPS